MTVRSGLFLCGFLLFYQGLVKAQSEREVPRVILSFYDPRVSGEIRWSSSHVWAEMPLNHLGLVVRYHDISHPLPDPSTMTDVRGVLLATDGDSVLDPPAFIEWAEEMADLGKKFVFVGDIPFQQDLSGNPTPLALVNRLLAKLGFVQEDDWITVTYDVELVKRDRRMIGFERDVTGVLPPYGRLRALHPDAEIYLRARRHGDPKTDSDLVFSTPNAGYVSAGYAMLWDLPTQRRQWIIDPFRFFRTVYDTDEVPKPDATTVSGRRAFYSHIDGDGWRNRSEIREYRKRRALSSEVILNEVLMEFTDLPVTVAPIAADLDPAWFGTRETQDIARRILRLPHVEAGTHTYSHPFEWGFFEGGDPEKERPFLKNYSKSWAKSGLASGFWSSLMGSKEATILDNKGPKTGGGKGTVGTGSADNGGLRDHETPRAYAVEPFDLGLECSGSIRLIQSLLPAGKRVEVLQWSGDTAPFEKALRLVREMGVRNINGGDTRFDREFPSYGWVAPIGQMVGGEVQIYASNSNENTYTDLWTDRYFGFIHLVRTLRNTEIPFRLKPLNVYYHMYSGEKLSSLNAVLANLRFARTQEIAPITTSRFAAIGEGFFSTRFVRIGADRWRVHGRGALQTIRFDRATFKSVDFALSRGVIGQRHTYGSLYVTLDKTVREPVIALKSMNRSDAYPTADRPYLVHARWEISDLRVLGSGFRFQATGFGSGEMVWKAPLPGSFSIEVRRGDRSIFSQRLQTDPEGLLKMNLPPQGLTPLTVIVKGTA